MAEQKSDKALEQNLEELRNILYSLEVPERSDKKLLTVMPARKLVEIAKFAEDIVYDCLSDHMLKISIGVEAVYGYKNKHVESVQREHRFPLGPGFELTTDRFNRFFDVEAGDVNHFFSDGNILLSLGATALNLQHGGIISLAQASTVSKY